MSGGSSWMGIVVLGLSMGCVAEPSSAATESQSASSSAGEQSCPDDSPPLGCPYTGSFGACGENPRSELDENCCRRPYCERHADCDAGMVCNYGGISSFGCEPQQGGADDGMCQCGADPDGRQRTMCMPASSVDPDWCTQLGTQGQCEAGEPVDLGDGDVRQCAWVVAEEVHFDAAAQSCSRASISPRCVTVRPTGSDGCNYDTCTLGDEPAEIHGPFALPLDPNGYELIVGGDQLCGVGTLVGAWIPADDASLGPCAMTCG